jgi:putative tryptophan/tyrosine transport system substrate-binding protein
MARRGLAGRTDECPLMNIADVEQHCRNDGSRPICDIGWIKIPHHSGLLQRYAILRWTRSSETEYYRPIGIYTGRVLSGERPSDLPVQQCSKVELIINMKTAKRLGLTMPLPLLGRADEAIRMRRREIIEWTAAAATVLFARSVRAQTNSSPAPKRIAIVDPSVKPEEMTINGYSGWKAYFAELNRHGYVEGRNLIVERYSALDRADRQPENARAAVASHPDLILAMGGPITRQLKPLTTTIPIIAMSGDPVAGKIVTNIARPDGNITGVSVDTGPELYGKRLQYLHETAPKLKNVRLLMSSSSVPFWEWTKVPIQEAAARAEVTISFAVLGEKLDREAFEQVFNLMDKEGVDGMMVSDAETLASRELIVELAARHRLATIYPFREFVEVGGLLSFGINFGDALRRMATMTADVLRGAKPADIPYYQQTKFELVLNRKTATSLGLEFPATLLAVANEVIE